MFKNRAQVDKDFSLCLINCNGVWCDGGCLFSSDVYKSSWTSRTTIWSSYLHLNSTQCYLPIRSEADSLLLRGLQKLRQDYGCDNGFLAPDLHTGLVIKVRRTAGSWNYLETRQGWSSMGQREAGWMVLEGEGKEGCDSRPTSYE